ncbi:tRNA preQ1(34) S-adenosylmethionine ribosyltransferase-isomerase QueA [Heliophilum fasciatum]|uniref:S-adenosylmethionine:tRNA ribosyltransferase-isomerase n=1 Tax=Heliophilum fasciatum TaxID=35700 RepID=A0A4R2RYY2_9FIRM|nr:tRNA preQ1(34) S-adenosylmethionine ribosyltransferase-isomerase QueA [Heliophilum fasciatum]MCW2278065.1 S-adenosylmethionine:tRNA ribosyltransferase-isomerase [Heliophilum fasciatum]TCP64315.1 S-adenosylmethionine--tRNA ribosyltransferase-isomerase [Heliophilum fasciatum]
MEVALFDYHLPPEAIAQYPIEPRDASKLMILDRRDGTVEHKQFRDLLEELQRGDVLVLNRSRVLPARLYGQKAGTDVAVEMVLLTPQGNDCWDVLVRPGRRLKPGSTIIFADGRLHADVIGTTAFGGRRVKLRYAGDLAPLLDEIGQMPLPPYIVQALPPEQAERYQTVYARERGSAAAPTAGLHFTPELLEALAARGVEITSVLLHVGLGTFRPVQAERIDEHVMHAEFYQIEADAAERINRARQEGRRVIAVGTTVTRTLETVASQHSGKIIAASGWTDIFIYPGYTFQAIDGLITNFHLPKSTLLMLISALAGREAVLNAYQQAIAADYRFFSFGDAMFIR